MTAPTAAGADGRLSGAGTAVRYVDQLEAHMDADGGIGPNNVRDLIKMVRYFAPQIEGWRCFHCGEFFSDHSAAKVHFGVREDEPNCKKRMEQAQELMQAHQSWRQKAEERAALVEVSLAAERARADKAERERDEAQEDARNRADFMRGRGYRECNIAACNCNSWHEGHAENRLLEIRDLIEGEELASNGVSTINVIRGLYGALSAANARIRELEAQRGGQVTEEGIEAVLGAANPLWFWIKSNQSGAAESLRARVRRALATDPAPARAEQEGEGRS